MTAPSQQSDTEAEKDLSHSPQSQQDKIKEFAANAEHLISWQELFQKTLPIFIAFLAVGGSYGILAINASLPVWFVILSSIIVFSGSVQFTAIPLLASGASLSSLFITSFVISLRHVFYTIALMPTMSKNIFRRWFEAVTICDQSFALMSIEPEKVREVNLLRTNLMLHFYWFLSTVLGVVLGKIIGNLVPHLEFALAALFVILAYEQFKKSRSYFGLSIAIIAFIIAKLFAYNWLILASILFCAISILLRNFYESKKLQQEEQ
ncbi:AzlC family ABC transporter permease [Psittacicella gerlachiana]|uniref:4-azaleucine resistance transporter AzlC n=1 Tax=Psittacicella gerlachiana TaxID=2028574 RepID=A0A3A1YBS0_9GAMM|nr:AzlC family ABC transporter permease [Psittacicella gerlachiana]RIY35011.1 hypothetical protein CKF59_04330 [Psittacicella gerlachiana]